MTDGTNGRMQHSFPAGLVEELSDMPNEIRTAEVARARQRAMERCFDDGAVVEEIAAQLLLISTGA